jgi:hypothetical protein
MTRATISMATLGVLLASSASAQAPAPAAFTVISPIFGQLVTFSMPAGFVAVAENTNGPNYIREAVLKGETATSWTQMITVTGAKGLAGNPKVSPVTVAGSIVGGLRIQVRLSRQLRRARLWSGQIRRAGRLCRGGKLRPGRNQRRQAQRDRAHCRDQRQRRLLHVAMGRTRVDGRQSPDRRDQMGGPAAPVAADPPLPDRRRRTGALPELCRQEIAPPDLNPDGLTACRTCPFC